MNDLQKLHQANIYMDPLFSNLLTPYEIFAKFLTSHAKSKSINSILKSSYSSLDTRVIRTQFFCFVTRGQVYSGSEGSTESNWISRVAELFEDQLRSVLIVPCSAEICTRSWWITIPRKNSPLILINFFLVTVCRTVCWW